MKIPPEVDRLMWAVAENPSDKSVEEFVVRFPDQRGELMKRVNMVRDLKHEVRPTPPGARERPKFQPNPSPRPMLPDGWPIAVAFALGALGTLAYASYSVARPTTPPAVTQVNLDPPVEPAVQYRNPPPVQQPPPAVAEQPPAQPQAPEQVDPTPPYTKPIHKFALKDESLVNALTLLTAGTGMHVTIGPNFPDQKISIDYENQSPMAILLDMAKQYAFTVSDEGHDEFLILPVPDNDSPILGQGVGSHAKVSP